MVGTKNKASVYSPAAQANRAAGDFLRMDAPMTNITINTATGELVDQDLAQHEATIERGLKTFVEVGQALQAIRDGRLYRGQYETFEAYCLERWSMSRPRAYQLIEAAEVDGRLSTNVDIRPATESVARPLTKLPAEEQADAWEEVVIDAEESGEKITAKKVEQVVAKRRGAAPPPRKTVRVVEPSGDGSLESLVEQLEEIANRPNSMIVTSELRGVVAAIKALVL